MSTSEVKQDATNEIDYEKLRKSTRDLEHVPGEDGWPIVGHTLQLLADPPGLTDKLYNKYGPIHRVNWMFERSVVFLGPDAAQYILKDPDNNLSSRLGWQSFFGEMFSGALLLRDFDEHKYHRRILQPAFSMSAMRNYVASLSEVIENDIIDWSKQNDFRAYPALKTMILNTAMKTFLGLSHADDITKINQSLIDVFSALVAIVRIPIPGLAMWKGYRGRKYLSGYLRPIIKERRESSKADMFTQLCQARSEDGEIFSDDEIIDHTITMLIAAHDTTTSTLTNMLYEIARQTEWQDKLRQEVISISNNTPDYSDLEKMNLTDQVFKEVLRLYPPVRMMARRTIRECEILGVTLPANTTIWASAEFTQKMPELWSNPDTFDPDRFSEQRAEHKRHPYAWFPFGGGIHTCLGMRFSEIQVKITMFHLLRKYRFTLPPGYKASYQILPIRKPKDDLPLVIEKI